MTRRRALVLVSGVLGGILTSAASRLMSVEYGKAFALQSALVISDYLVAVAPSPSGAASGRSVGYDVGQLLAHARALDLLPPWTSRLEVYHGTAPLVHSTATPLTPEQFGRIRSLETTEWRAGNRAVLVPLTDRERWDVLGAVEVVVAAVGPGWWLGMLGPAFLSALAWFAGLPRGTGLGAYWSAALALAGISIWRMWAIVAALEASWTEAMHGLKEGHAVALGTIPPLHLETTTWAVVLLGLALLGPLAATGAAVLAPPADSES
ncbi:MAG TPA: hypothetical protein VLT79_02775 [Gemmatimonadales bacterium]|nr:hypothetical protein [Gemmatimonadales bacterium]